MTLQLRNIFKHHPGSACQTHELLGCRCHFDEEPTAAVIEEEAEEEDAALEMGFTQASQYNFEEPKVSSAQLRVEYLSLISASTAQQGPTQPLDAHGLDASQWHR